MATDPNWVRLGFDLVAGSMSPGWEFGTMPDQPTEAPPAWLAYVCWRGAFPLLWLGLLVS